MQGGTIDFDRCIATPDMMPLVNAWAKSLGSQFMPNPKTGTVNMDVTKAVQDAKGGAVSFRVEKAGIVHAVWAKLLLMPQNWKKISRHLPMLYKKQNQPVQKVLLKTY